ncbi:hypothetical protein Ddc_11958 [Ditylenchus destructor]|nr:hypothetical protein Ddc_11958 [Ditylenchus destructor]
MSRENSAKMALRATPATIANTVWAIEDIVEGPKFETVNGKKKKYYKVKWSESYELASNIPHELIDIFEKRGKNEIKILGPVIDQKGETKEDADEENQSNGKSKQFKLNKTKFAVEIGDDVSIMPYSKVKSLYKEELFEYFEERAKIDLKAA